jgi:predicted transcriptional regulator of viral defense system
MSGKRYKESQGFLLLDHIFHYKGLRIFTTKEAYQAAAELGIPKKAVNTILSRLTKQGITHRLRRGLYSSVGRLGELKDIHPFVVSAYLIRPSAISHWSALQYHGLTEQLPTTVSASTPLRVYTPSMRDDKNKSPEEKHAFYIDNVRYEYMTIKKERYAFGIGKEWISPHFVVNITDKERTIIDLFADMKIFGGIGEALGILENNIEEIDIEKLIEYAIKYDEKSLAKRLGWALEYFGIEKELLKPLLDVPLTSFCPLDPTESARGPYDKRWMIQNNLTSKEEQ